MNMRKFAPHIIAVIVFLLISIIQFAPLLKGKALYQGDIAHFKGMSKEIADYREATGEEPLWTNNMFGGMPAYQISVIYTGNLMRWIDKVLYLGLPSPMRYLFLYFVGFYILLLCLRVNPWLSLAGALAFALSSYNFIIIEAGHNSKAHAIAYMAPVVGGVLLIFRNRLFSGFILTTAFLSLQIMANHPQITYYLALCLLVLGIIKGVEAIRQKTLPAFAKQAGILVAAAILALGTNIASLWATLEYGKYTTRGPSELTIGKHDERTSGLDKDYAMAWSYGIPETMTLLIPNFMGGSSSGELGTSSEMYKFLQQANVPNAKEMIKRLPMYWGDQSFTSGPVYAGAMVIFLFVLGLLILKGPIRWWLLSATILSILLAWGKNFYGFSEFFLDYFPGYNKFRAVSMTLVIASLTLPLLAFLTLHHLFKEQPDPVLFRKKLMRALYITGGVTLVVAAMGPSFFDFHGLSDDQLKASGWPLDALIKDRKSMMRMDALRSLFFILLTAGILFYTFIKTKLTHRNAAILLALVVVIDLWPVGRRYLNNDDFVAKQEMKQPYQASQANLQILQDKDPNFRVYNVTRRLDQDSETSYFHKSLGGYHGAKLKRYQELIDFQISQGNMNVINMLNTKYFIVPTPDKKGVMAESNPSALGNAWFVDDYRLVANADSEMTALSNFDPSTLAIVDQRFKDQLSGFAPGKDPGATISLTSYKPNELIYASHSTKEQLAVFSEIYYAEGWNAYVDGQLSPHFRANYVLRSMRVPAGDHTVAFRFEPRVYPVGESISLACSGLLLLLCVGYGWKTLGHSRKEEPATEA
ncbi:MAG: hypothetical protein KDD36_01590 [Flavobacteriales bacterium]|nr:hypothetical protein [Flavobacteriales bacterium]